MNADCRRARLANVPATMGALVASLALGFLAACQPPIRGPVIVPQTPEAQKCARECEARKKECYGECQVDTGLLADPSAKPGCEKYCDQDLERCYLGCPGATQGKAAATVPEERPPRIQAGLTSWMRTIELRGEV